MTAITKKCFMVAKTAPEVRANYQVGYHHNNTNTTIVGVTPKYGDVRNYSRG